MARTKKTGGATKDLDDSFSLETQQAPQTGTAKKIVKPAGNKPSPRKPADATAKIISYQHADKRINNPEVGMVKPENDPDQAKTKWAYDPHIDPALQFDSSRAQIETLIDNALASGDDKQMRAALQTLKRQAQPYLNWAGKAERTSFEVDTVSLHVHERIDPATILTGIRKRMEDGRGKDEVGQADMFRAWFEQPLPLHKAVEFYKHDRGWMNRLVSGDSLLVMNSLLKKEGMAGQVQMIYIDPPYGIKYGSNFQPFVNKRDVKDRRDEDLTQEPEMIKAFRDTWELGIHSYLTYLRDRLLLAKELLHESGSAFVQISDENVHHVRELMDEVFGNDNFVGLIAFKKTATQTSEFISGSADYIVWYSKKRSSLKYQPLYNSRLLGEEGADAYTFVELNSGERIRLNETAHLDSDGALPNGVKSFRMQTVLSAREGRPAGPGTAMNFPVAVNGNSFVPAGSQGWKTTQQGMYRLRVVNRLHPQGNSLAYVRYIGDFPVMPINNLWMDTQSGSGMDKQYVVQTNVKVIERCMLMTTDPGDLVLDPTCGSGTTAFVAEKWGRRWITADTSRVAVTLAKQRLMTAGYDYFDLRYPHEGLKSGFIYKTVPHVTLKSIANNPQIDEIWAEMHPAIELALVELNTALGGAPSPQPSPAGGRGSKEIKEWEVPFDFSADWPKAARAAFDAFHAARQAMQKKMDASIAANADQETLFDQPQISKDKLRITGPFTVEAVPFPAVLSLDALSPNPSPASGRGEFAADAAVARSGESARQHGWRDELLKTGIRGKSGQMFKFADLETLPGTRSLHCSGHLDSGERVVVSFGPQHAALEQRQVALALNEAETLRPAPKFVVFCAFTFDPEAAKDIDETKWPGVTLLKAQMNTDLLTEDLKKARSNNQSFWLMGQPDVVLTKLNDGQFQIEVNGFDYFDPSKGELVSGGKSKIAAWMLDTDYDERSLFPRQVFFPMAGAKDGWNKLKRDIKAELNEALLEQYHGTVSLPFSAGENRKVAVKIVDDRGIESLKIIALED